MPACFQLTRKGMHSPSTLNDIDRAICQYLEVPVHETKYVSSWYDCIGFALAMGKTWADIGEIFQCSPTMLRINHFLQENYTADAWAEVGHWRNDEPSGDDYADRAEWNSRLH